MDDFRVTIKRHAYGQARPYADSIYSATMIVEQLTDGNWEPCQWADIKHFSRLVRNWTHEGKPYGKPMGECFAPHLTKFQKRDIGVYEVEVTEIFTD